MKVLFLTIPLFLFISDFLNTGLKPSMLGTFLLKHKCVVLSSWAEVAPGEHIGELCLKLKNLDTVLKKLLIFRTKGGWLRVPKIAIFEI